MKRITTSKSCVTSLLQNTAQAEINSDAMVFRKADKTHRKTRWVPWLLKDQSYRNLKGLPNIWKRLQILGTLSEDIVFEIKSSHSDKDQYKGVWCKELQQWEMQGSVSSKIYKAKLYQISFRITLCEKILKISLHLWFASFQNKINPIFLWHTSGFQSAFQIR